MSGLLKILKVVLPVVLCMVLAIALFISWRASLSTTGPRAILAFGAAGLVIWFAHSKLFPEKRNPSPDEGASANRAAGTGADDASVNPSSVRNAIAFDSIVFTLLGLATAVAAAPQWETALLLSGACLLIGAFFGLLFGYPQGIAQTATTPLGHQTGQPDQTAQQGTAQQSPPLQQTTPPQQGTTQQNTATRTAQTSPQGTPQKNLIAESASTLGKVIAGFTLAKATPLIRHFHQICDTVGPALCQQSCDGGFVLAGAIILYFFATGFFSGLLLPSYFMSGKFA